MNTIQCGEPRPLRQSADTIPFPLEALPSVLRNTVQAISITTSTDVGMAGTAMLSAVGYCFTSLYRLAGRQITPNRLYCILSSYHSHLKEKALWCTSSKSRLIPLRASTTKTIYWRNVHGTAGHKSFRSPCQDNGERGRAWYRSYRQTPCTGWQYQKHNSYLYRSWWYHALIFLLHSQVSRISGIIWWMIRLSVQADWAHVSFLALQKAM